MSRAKSTTPETEVVSAIKGFDRNLQCRGFQFEIGKTYTHEGAVKACASGFHACEYPLDVFNYYYPGDSRYAEVTQSGTLSRHSDDSKIASARITIEAEISIPKIVERAITWVLAQTKPADSKHAEGYQSAASSTGDQSAASSTGDQSAASSTGYRSAASSTGYRSAASSTGYRSAASSTGDQSAASSTGYRSAASSTGDRSAASVDGEQSCATSAGYDGRAMAAKDGCALFLVFRNENYEIVHARAAITGRDGIKASVWYRLNNAGDFEEVA